MERCQHPEPFLGNSLPDDYCGRVMRGGLCGNPSAYHIIWGRYASTACLECKDYLLMRDYAHEEIHEIAPGCSDPLSLWFPEESVCRRPRSLAERSRGRIVLG